MAPAARTDGSLARNTQLVVGVCAVVAFAASCGGTASATGCRKSGERVPPLARAVRVAEALKQQGGLVLVSGALLARDGKPQRICAGLAKASPPRCREPSLAIDGVRDLAGFENISSHGRVQWVESVSIEGRVAGKRLVFEFACATERVQKAFHDRTGETLTLNGFGSNADVERLDFTTLPNQEPARLRLRYGYFAILVRVRRGGGDPFAAELRGRRIDARGIVWLRDAGQWYAAKRYGPNLLLGWVAGGERRINDRWLRLDEILTQIAAE